MAKQADVQATASDGPEAMLVAGARRRRRQRVGLAVLVVLLVIAASIGMSLGSVSIAVGTVWPSTSS